jgi:hypothetical protein
MGSYRERLLVPVSYWLLAVPSIAFLGAEAWFVAGGIIPPITLAVLSVMAAVFLINWGSATIEVTGGVLRAGRDTLPLAEAGEVLALDEKQAALLRGPRGEPAAHPFLPPPGRPGRPSLPPALRQAGRLHRPGRPHRRRALLADLDQAPGPGRRCDRAGRR